MALSSRLGVSTRESQKLRAKEKGKSARHVETGQEMGSNSKHEVRTDLSGCHWLLVLSAEEVDRRYIMPKVLLTPNKDHRYPPAEMIDLTDPLHEGYYMDAMHCGNTTGHTFSVTFSNESGRSMA